MPQRRLGFLCVRVFLGGESGGGGGIVELYRVM